MRERTRLLVSPLQRPLQAMAQAGGNAAIELAWLGQAGFLVRSPKLALAIDPYLSDSLARKYAGTATPHERMMPVPVAPRDLVGLDFVLCTHRHTDHMDPETLTAIFSANETALLVAPRSARARVREIGVPDARVRYVTAGDVLAPTAELSIRVIASAHEAIDRDENGDHAYVGYALTLGELTVYHSGDCVPHEGLAATLSETGADLALLPVNGRRPELAARGIPGNFTPREAAALCVAAEVPALIAHHFGMFSFNSADPAAVLAEIRAEAPDLCAFAARPDTVYAFAPNS